MRPQRVFSATQVPDTIDPQVRAVLQAFAQAIDQLIASADLITFATSTPDVRSGRKAGRFNGIFLKGSVTGANTDQVFPHGLSRVPVGALEVLTVPAPPTAQVAAALALMAADSVSVTLRASAANRQFTLILF